MFNLTLYKRGIRETLRTLLIFTAIILMYFSVIVPMFDPKLGEALNQFVDLMPEVMAMFGMSTQSTVIIGFLSTYLYGFLMIVLPMIFTILTVQRLITRHIDKGSMVSLLCAPTERTAVVFTQAKVLASGIFFIIAIATIFGIAMCQISYPGELDIGKFILLNIGMVCLQFFIAGICFLCACIFNDSKYSLGIGAGIPLIAFIIQMMSNVGSDLEKFKYLTFLTLFNPEGIIDGKMNSYIGMIILLCGAIILFYIAIKIFNKKDLYI